MNYKRLSDDELLNLYYKEMNSNNKKLIERELSNRGYNIIANKRRFNMKRRSFRKKAIKLNEIDYIGNFYIEDFREDYIDLEAEIEITFQENVSLRKDYVIMWNEIVKYVDDNVKVGRLENGLTYKINYWSDEGDLEYWVREGHYTFYCSVFFDDKNIEVKDIEFTENDLNEMADKIRELRDENLNIISSFDPLFMFVIESVEY